MRSKIEILVIDDNKETAQSYSDLITTYCNLQSFATSDIGIAFKCVSENPIKIVLLDERMPTPGHKVFPKLKEINSNLKIVMVTGEASAEEILKIDSLGYAAKLHKNNIVELPSLIHRLYAEYETDLVKNVTIETPFYKEWKFKFWHVSSINYYLLAYKDLNNNYIDQSKWKTIERVTQGEKQHKEVVIELKTSEKIAITQKLDTHLGYNSKSFLSKLESTLDCSINLNNEVMNIKTETTRKTTELSIKNDEIFEGKRVISKNYETNQVYRQILLHIKKECNCCNEHVIIPVIINKPINKKIYRLKIYTEDNNEHIISTGDFTW